MIPTDAELAAYWARRCEAEQADVRRLEARLAEALAALEGMLEAYDLLDTRIFARSLMTRDVVRATFMDVPDRARALLAGEPIP